MSISIIFFRLENTAPSAKDISGTAYDKTIRNESKVAPSHSPHQPKKFSFPYRSYGKTKVVQRRFQAEWFDTWTWITYDETKDVVFCIVCQQASKEKKLSYSKHEPTFISKGYCNWKEPREAFRSHASTKCHKESIEKVVTLTETTNDIGESLSSSYANEIDQNKNMLLKIFENIRFLARQNCRSEVIEMNLIVTSYNCLNFVWLTTVQCSSGYKRGQTSIQVRIYKMRF